MPVRKFPEGFLWGTSTSSFQVEMGAGEPSTHSDWWAWVHDEENIKKGNASGAYPENGPGFWEYYKYDLRRAREELGNNAIRLSVDWSRIFPKPTTDVCVHTEYDEHGYVYEVDVDESEIDALGKLADRKSVKHYRDMFIEAHKNGLIVFLTLYHWPLPLWLHDPIACRDNVSSTTRRGWLNQSTIVEFAKYAAYAASVFGDLVDLYATINEAPIIAKYGYLHENVHFPPGLNDVELFLSVFRNLAIAHGLGYKNVKKWDNIAVKEGNPATVGVVSVIEQYDPADPENSKDREVADFNSYLWNTWNLNAVIRGEYDMNLDRTIDDDERMPHRVKGCDFIGVDYYLREKVKYTRKKGDPRFNFTFTPSIGETSDTGWEIFPEGLRNALRFTKAYGLPVYITENGVADAEDKLRSRYMLSHLEKVYEAISQDGVDVRGYFYWSLIDNYSWFSGYKSRFGLFQVDMKTKERRPTKGVEVYRNVSTKNELP